jgi:hypothetical protein
VELGGGKVLDPVFSDCGVVGESRYMVDGQPDLAETFSCLATVGTTGRNDPRPMDAMIRAVTTLNQAGECNEGFLRDDAILVVTFLASRDDDNDSEGDPKIWEAYLVDAKNGDESAVAVLGFVDDSDLPDGQCPEDYSGSPGLDLRDFAESFTRGAWCSICAPDYAPCFLEAVSAIDAACDEF